MNLILFNESDFCAHNRICLRDRRHKHIVDIHKAQPDSSLRVGQINGLSGTGQVISIDDTQVTLEISLTQAAPAQLPLTLLLALPRPKMLKRILQTISTMGVKELYLLHSYRVDKSYWSSPLLAENAINEQLQLGLEQAMDTHMPVVHVRKRFKPFVEDELPAICANTRGLVAHPYYAIECPEPGLCPTTLAIGPEGGFIPYEVEKLKQAGLTPFHVGQRILRVETAIPAILSRLFPTL
ncbi:16S rRNA (uracil(1498)-N(3))-methyltransferase [Neptunomonas antarctica]|uniref:Ribosomal RNA small subunit methyltransferase E n=1 Tax=Neptunomonas antarctica TaxID=619304 RepID=A0A1N7NLG0_9GAMM|nr:16S rRNA (uracil(1498)-N(3))-methyltransferase [Neptunomonas antarctica]SIS99058.1 RNA methyltransferase, RsmE family [Neptunomonas antarctica]